MYMVRSRRFLCFTGLVRDSLLELISYVVHGNICNPLYLHMVDTGTIIIILHTGRGISLSLVIIPTAITAIIIPQKGAQGHLEFPSSPKGRLSVHRPGGQGMIITIIVTTRTATLGHNVVIREIIPNSSNAWDGYAPSFFSSGHTNTLFRCTLQQE